MLIRNIAPIIAAILIAGMLLGLGDILNTLLQL